MPIVYFDTGLINNVADPALYLICLIREICKPALITARWCNIWLSSTLSSLGKCHPMRMLKGVWMKLPLLLKLAFISPVSGCHKKKRTAQTCCVQRADIKGQLCSSV